MDKKFTNKTSTPQQINLCNGDGVTVLPGEYTVQKTDVIFPEEINRCMSFFLVEDIEEPKPSSFQKKVIVETEDKGGNE